MNKEEYFLEKYLKPCASVNKQFPLEIGDDCFISMDASITKDLNNGSVVLPAKSNYFESNDELAIKIKKNYFGI